MQFVNLAADDYHILFASAACDVGDPAGISPAPPPDADDYPRPYSLRVDISAHECLGGRPWFLPIISR